MDDLETMKTHLCIIRSGPVSDTDADADAEADAHAHSKFKPIVFEGWMANVIARSGQLTSTSEVNNFPSFFERRRDGEGM